MDEPTATLIQISDPHVEVAGATARYGTDTAVVLERALRRVEDSGLRPDALVLTGDLTEHGRPEEYRRLRAAVAPVAERLGAAVVYVAGNHDVPAVLRRELLDTDADIDTDDPSPLHYAVRLGGLRVVVLDSSVPDRAYGALSDQQLSWLRAELAEPAPDGTVLVLHHPPLPSVMPVTAAIELQQPGELVAAIAGRDVRIVLAGHTHVVSTGSVAGIPVWTGGALASTADALAPLGTSRYLRAPGLARIDLFPGAVIATAVPVAVDPGAELDPAATAAVVAELRSELPAG